MKKFILRFFYKKNDLEKAINREFTVLNVSRVVAFASVDDSSNLKAVKRCLYAS